MSQEGTNLPQEVQGSHDLAIGPHGNTHVSAGSVTVMLASSNSGSVDMLASKISNDGSEQICPTLLHAGEDNNSASKTANQARLHGCEDKAASKIAKQAVLHATKDNNAPVSSNLGSMVVLLAGEEKGKKARSKRPIQARAHADVDSNARCKYTSPTMLHSSNDNNGGCKTASLGVPHTIMENTAGSKQYSPVVLQATEENTKLKLASPAAFHAGEDKDNNIESKFTGPMVHDASKDKKIGSTLAIQVVSHGESDARSKLTSPVMLHASKVDTTRSNLTLRVVPHTSKQKNLGSKATGSTVIDDGKSKAKEGKNKVSGEEGSGNIVEDASGGHKKPIESLLSDGGGIHEDDGRNDSGKGKGATTVGYADHDFHIFMERERRKKMKNMFSTLHALLPQLPDKADKAAIVGEAVDYIKALEGTVQKLEKLKLERMRAMARQLQQGASGSGMARASASSTSHLVPVPAPAPAPAPSATSAVTLAAMVHGWQAQQAVVVATAKAAAAAAAAAGMGSSSSAIAPHGSMLLPVTLPIPAPGFQTWSGENIVVSVASNEAYINMHAPRQLGMLSKVLFVLERHRIDVVTTTVSTQGDERMFGIHARINSTSAHFPENLSAEDRFKLVVSEMQQLINN